MYDHFEMSITERTLRDHRVRPARQRTVAAVLVLGAILSPALLTGCTTSEGEPKAASTSKASSDLVGSWASTVTKEDLLRVVPDFQREYLCDNAGRFDWTFDSDGTFEIDQAALPECPKPEVTHTEDRWSVDGNRVTFTNEQEVYEWSVAGDELTFKHVSGGCVPCEAINTANPWKRVG